MKLLKKTADPTHGSLQSLHHSGDTISYISQLVIPVNKEKMYF